MEITTKKILDFLKSKGIRYILHGDPQEHYTVASIFEPIPNGFYYFVGDRIPDTIEDSLILTDKLPESSSNVILVVKDDPQRVFYQLMESLYAEKPNGRISPTAVIHPEAEIGGNVQIDDYCVIGRARIGDNVIIKSHTVIEDNTEIGEGTVIENHSHIGARGMAWIWDKERTGRIILPQLGGVKIGKHCILGSHTVVVRGSLNEYTEIGDYSILAPGCRLGHGTKIGRYVHLANHIATGGNTVIGDYSFVGSSATFRPKVKIHPHTIVGSGAVVVKNTSGPGLTLIGVPAKETETKKQPAGMPKPKLTQFGN